MLITEQGIVTPQTDFTTGIGDTPKGQDFVFTDEDLTRFQKYDLRVDDAISQGFTKEEIVELSKEIEQEDLYKQQVSEQAPPGIQSIPVNPSTIPPATPPQDDGFFNVESEALDFAKLGGQVLSNIVSNVAGFGLEKTGELVENQTLYNLGKYIKERSGEIGADLGNSLSEGGKRDISRTIFNIPPERKGIPDITQDQVFGNANLGTVLGLGTQAIASMGPTLKLAQPIAKGLGMVPGVKAVEKATGFGVSGAGGLAAAGGTIEGMNSAADAYSDAMSATDEEIVKSPLYKSMAQLIAPQYPNATAKELIDFTRHQVANQTAYEIGTKAGTLVAATSLPFGSFLGRMGVLGGGKLGNQYKQGFTKSFWTGSTREGGQEFVQEGGQQLLANYGSYLAGKSPNAISLEGVVEAGAKGMVGGTTVGGPMGAYYDAKLPTKPEPTDPDLDPKLWPSAQEEAARETDKQQVYDAHVRAWEEANQRPYDAHVEAWENRFDVSQGEQQDAQVKTWEDYWRVPDIDEDPRTEKQQEAQAKKLRDLQRKADEQVRGRGYGSSARPDRVANVLPIQSDQQVKDFEQYGDSLDYIEEKENTTTPKEDEFAPDPPNEESDIPPFEEEVVETTPAPPVVTTGQDVDPALKRKATKARAFVSYHKTPRGAIDSTNTTAKEVLALAKELGMDTSKSFHKKGKQKGKPKRGERGKAANFIFNWEKENTTSPFEGEVKKSKKDVSLTRFEKGKSQTDEFIEDEEDLSGLDEEQLKERKRVLRKEKNKKRQQTAKRFAGLYRAKSKWIELYNDSELGSKFLKYLSTEGTMGTDAEGNQDPTKFTPTSQRTDIPEGTPIKRIDDSDLVLRMKKKAIASWTKAFTSISNVRGNYYKDLDLELNKFAQDTYRRSDLGEISEGTADQLIQQKQAELMNNLKQKSAGWLKKANDAQALLEKRAKEYGFDIKRLKPMLAGFADELSLDEKDTTFLNQEIAESKKDFTLEFKEMFPDLYLDKEGEFREVGVKKSGDAKKQLDEFAVEEMDIQTDTLSEMEQRKQSEGFDRLKGQMGGDTAELGVDQRRFRSDQGAEFTKAEIKRMIQLGQTLTNNAKKNKLNAEDVKFFRQLIGLDEDGNVPIEKIQALQESERRKVLKLFGELVQRARDLGVEIDIPKTPRGKAWLGAMLGGKEGFARLPKPPSSGEKRGSNAFQVHWDEFLKEYVIDEAPDWVKKPNGATDELGLTISDLVFDVSSGNWVPKPRWMMVEESGKPKRDQVRYNEETGKYEPLEDQSPAIKITAPQLSKHYPMKLSISDVGAVKTIEIIVDDGSIDGQHIGTVEIANQDMEATDLTGWEPEKKTFKVGEIISANFNLAKNKYGISPRDINTIVANAVGTSVVTMANSGLTENFFNYRKNVREGLVELDKKYTNEGDVLLTRQYDQIAYIVENSDPKATVESDNKYDQHVKEYLRGEPEFRMRLGGDKAVPKEGEVSDKVTERQYQIEEEKWEKERESLLYDPYTDEAEYREGESSVDDDLEPVRNTIMDDPEALSNMEGELSQAQSEADKPSKIISPSETYTGMIHDQHVNDWVDFLMSDVEGIVRQNPSGELEVTNAEKEFYDGAGSFNQEETALEKNIDNTAQDETELEAQCKGKGRGRNKTDDDDLENLEFV